jgi:hypothetical protein
MGRYAQPNYRLGDTYWVGLSTQKREVDWVGYERQPILVVPGKSFFNTCEIHFPDVPLSCGDMTWLITHATVFTTGPHPAAITKDFDDRTFVRTMIRRSWMASAGVRVILYEGDLAFG